jgi:transcriptional antiterminator RfaH
MTNEPANQNAKEPKEWFCLRTQTKREHIAAAILDRLDEVEVFCPRISQVKKTRTGKKRFVEAMFPGYIFAKFQFHAHSRQVVHSHGITRMVELGERRIIPQYVVEDLKASLPEDVIEAPDLSILPGAEIELIAGSLKGLNGKVLAQMSAQNSIQILLDFLGREIKVSIANDNVLLARDID